MKKESHIKPGMYVKTSEIKDIEEWKQVIDAFVEAGANGTVVIESCGYYKQRWPLLRHVGVDSYGDIEHYRNKSTYGCCEIEPQQVTVDFILNGGKKEPAADAEGWIVNTGECPYEKGTLIDVKYLCGDTEEGVPALVELGDRSTAVDWSIDNVEGDITHHRLHKASEALQDTLEKGYTEVLEDTKSSCNNSTGSPKRVVYIAPEEETGAEEFLFDCIAMVKAADVIVKVKLYDGIQITIEDIGEEGVEKI
jgi:hypothetical protein